jgi:hypothetical protein
MPIFLTKKNRIILISLFIIALLIGVSTYAYFEYLQEEPEIKDTEPLPPEFDDRINPFLNTQTVSLEIHRIRKKGIEEVIRKIGTAWKKTPSFYYVAFLNDAELTSETLTGWDTGYVGRESFRIVENEQLECKISLTIFEPMKQLFRTINEEIEGFEITYNFKTGRWTGDDDFVDDPDGYGHYNGEHYEIWFDVHQSDSDDDGIPYWTEVNVLHTDPTVDDSNLDPDNDGIPTPWEWKWGYNVSAWDDHANLDPDLDGLQNIEEYQMEKWLANPYQPEIYIEVDFMKGKTFGPDYVFWEESQQLVMDKFSQHSYHALNYSNTISVHIDDGCMGGGGELLKHIGYHIDQETGVISEFYKYHFADERKGIFRYLVMAYDAGWAHPQDYKGWYDVMCIGASPSFLMESFRGRNVEPRIQRLVQAIQVMHEVGHTCDLMPDYCQGIDNGTTEAIDYWRNYQSCMNYWMMYRPTLYHRFILGKDYGLIFEYSDGSRNEPDHPDCDDWSHIDISFFQKTSPLVEGIES